MKSKTILCARGEKVTVDAEDFSILNGYKWSTNNRGYVYGVVNGSRFAIHRLIVNCPSKKQVDHINGDRLDNRKQNLRICTNSQNHQNKPKTKRNTSGYKGIRFKRGRWHAHITLNRKQKHLGAFDHKMEAVHAYDAAAKKYFGEFALTNFKS